LPARPNAGLCDLDRLHDHGLPASFTYAEIAGLFPNKSGGASIYGATAWLRYSKSSRAVGVVQLVRLVAGAVARLLDRRRLHPHALAPVRCSPRPRQSGRLHCAHVGTAPATPRRSGRCCNTGHRNWTLFSHTLVRSSFTLNATFFIGAVLMLIIFSISIAHSRDRMCRNTSACWSHPMLIVGVVPIVTGQINWANFSPLVPLAAAYAPEPGSWNIAGWTLVLGGMFIAAWSTYVSKRPSAIPRNSRTRAPTRSRRSSIPACSACFCLSGSLHLPGCAWPQRHAGDTDRRRLRVADALAGMVGGGALIHSPW